MAYTKFGEFMRIQRIRHKETMSNTAILLGVTLPFVSAVETGKRNVPDNWFDIITKHYSLSVQEQQELSQAIAESKTQAKIDLTSATQSQRRVALQFQRSFEDLDDETANAIFNLLNKEEK